MNNSFLYYHTFSQMPDTRHLTQEKVDYYYNLYFSLKKRKDIRRSAKTRLMKDAEKNWQLWKGLQEWEKEIYS